MKATRAWLLPIVFLTLGGWSARLPADEAPAAKIEWQSWTDDLFEKAKKENRLVILDLEAVWCHWCHVMEEQTYSNPKVIALIRSRYLAVRVDQDSRPDLSNRYEDYGWPATIIFSPTGQELVKRAGFIEPDAMASLLQAVIDDPTPGPSVSKEPPLRVAASPFLNKKQRAMLMKAYGLQYDQAAGGWGFGHKYLQAESAEWAIRQAKRGDKISDERARRTLAQVQKIWDRTWGGIYQYSVGGDWNEPHFEKIMSVQSDAIRIYAQAYALWKDPAYLTVAQSVQKYLTDFLRSPEGAFYTSQDADLIPGQHSDAYFKLDDAGRRAKGIPRVDKHEYARENGWASLALTGLASASGSDGALGEAQQSLEWALQNRAIEGGGFRHDADDGGRLYLGDTLGMGQATLAMYAATGERRWLKIARDAAGFLTRNFAFTDSSGHQGGFVTVKSKGGFPAKPERDENIAVARFCNLLYHYTGDTAHRDCAQAAMRFVVGPEQLKIPPAAGILLADAELGEDPLHITVIGSKKDAKAKALFLSGQAYPISYKRIEWWDKSEGTLPRGDVTYPELEQAAAFICTAQRCSLPIFEPDKLGPRIDAVLKRTR